MEINEISYRILNTSTNFPKALKLNQRLITDKVDIVNTFNSHFISASSITDNSLVIKLKLVLNVNKTKYIIFTRSRSMSTVPPILTIEDLHIERVPTDKYLGIWLDEKLAFDVHINYLVKRLKPRLGFLFREKKCFSFTARKRIIQSTFFFNLF